MGNQSAATIGSVLDFWAAVFNLVVDEFKTENRALSCSVTSM